jgi:hypothetical protein
VEIAAASRKIVGLFRNETDDKPSKTVMIVSRRARNILGAIVTVLVFTPLILTAIRKVAQGHGADAYQNVYGL